MYTVNLIIGVDAVAANDGFTFLRSNLVLHLAILQFRHQGDDIVGGDVFGAENHFVDMVYRNDVTQLVELAELLETVLSISFFHLIFFTMDYADEVAFFVHYAHQGGYTCDFLTLANYSDTPFILAPEQGAADVEASHDVTDEVDYQNGPHGSENGDSSGETVSFR